MLVTSSSRKVLLKLITTGSLYLKFVSELSVELEKIPGIEIVSIFDHAGEYDWKSDTYIRPCTAVHYNLIAC